MKLSCGLHIPSHTAAFHTLQNKSLGITEQKTWNFNHTAIKPNLTLHTSHCIRLPLSPATSHTIIQVHTLHTKSKYCTSVLSKCLMYTETHQAGFAAISAYPHYFCGTWHCTVRYHCSTVTCYVQLLHQNNSNQLPTTHSHIQANSNLVVTAVGTSNLHHSWWFLFRSSLVPVSYQNPVLSTRGQVCLNIFVESL